MQGRHAICNILQGSKNKRKKDVGMTCQKVCKQGRDDIKMKLNIQSPICVPFLH